jgi:hypothetical protein
MRGPAHVNPLQSEISMKTQSSIAQKKRLQMLSLRARLPAIVLAPIFAVTGLLPALSYAGDCRSVRGVMEETQVTGPACSSPVGLCTVALFHGQLKGQARFVATGITPSADTPATGVVFVIGDTSVVDARLGHRRGTLSIKNAAAYRTVGDGDLSDSQVIVGGTGDFAGASGSLRISGTFLAGAGTASYEGSVCMP